MAGGMRARGCMAGGIYDKGHAWQGTCMAGGMHGMESCVVGCAFLYVYKSKTLVKYPGVLIRGHQHQHQPIILANFFRKLVRGEVN